MKCSSTAATRATKILRGLTDLQVVCLKSDWKIVANRFLVVNEELNVFLQGALVDFGVGSSSLVS